MQIKKYINEALREFLIESATLDYIYQKYYNDIPENYFKKVVSSDPTYNPQNPDKIGKYGKWLLRLYKKYNLKLEDLYKAHDYLEVFDKFRKVIENNDINTYKSLPDLYDVVKPYIVNPNQATSHQDEIRIAKDEADKVYEDDTWLVIVPHTKKASCYYGKNTKWCTAATKSKNTFDEYNKEGSLYININKKTGKKYQFHFESRSFMNELNMPMRDIAYNIGMTDGLHDFYTSKYGDEAYFAFDYGEQLDPEKIKGLEHIYLDTDNDGKYYITKMVDGEYIKLYEAENYEDIKASSFNKRYIFIYNVTNGKIIKLFDTKDNKVLFSNSYFIEIINNELLLIFSKNNKKYIFDTNINKLTYDLGKNVVNIRWLPKVNKQFNIEEYNDVLYILHTGFVSSLFDTFNNSYITNPIIKHVKPYNLYINGKPDFNKTYASFETTNGDNFYLNDNLQLIDITNEKVPHIMEDVSKMSDIIDAEKGINKKPSEAQKEAGNYKMGHIRLNGFDITIENPKGSYRYWKDENGKEGKTLINNHYGYFKNTLGKDGDQIDVFIGSKLKSDKIYVVDQNNSKNEFDESKVMLGFDNMNDAKKAYMSNYSKGWKGFRSITGVNIDTFKKWLYDGKKQRKPFSDYIKIKNNKLSESILNEYYDAYNSDDVDKTNNIEYYINEADPDDYDNEYYDSMEDFIEQETSYDIKATDYNDEVVFEQDGLTIEEIEEIFDENIANMIRNREGKRGNYYYLSDLLDSSVDLSDVNQVNSMAKKIFPTTNEYHKDERGYILTDGTILIFGEDTDHVSITRIDGMTINKFLSLGNIRIGHNFFDLQKEPTYEQRMQLIRLINSYSDDELYVDIGEYNGNDSQYERKVTSAKYINPNYRTVLGEIAQYFRNGIKLKGGYNLYESKKKKEEKSGLEKFLDKHGIKEIKCGVGFSEDEQKYYGWSHRAIYGFGIGSKVKRGDCAYNGKEWTAKTLKDAKKMAEDFAKSVA